MEIVLLHRHNVLSDRQQASTQTPKFKGKRTRNGFGAAPSVNAVALQASVRLAGELVNVS